MAFLTRLCNTRGDEVDVEQSVPACNVSLPNSTLKPAPDDSTFPLFSYLPKEVRLQIWEEATPRERLVHLVIGCWRNRRGEDEAPVRYLEKNHLGNPISGSGYTLCSEDGGLDHALLFVNREARQAVLDFYRIHIPVSCSQSYHRKPGHCRGRAMTLHINPEHDVLHIVAQEPVKHSMIDFLWDLKAYDPKGVGLLKLSTSMSEFCMNDLQYLKPSDLMLIRQRQVFIETLSQLQEVWFMSMETSWWNKYEQAAADGLMPYRSITSGYEHVGPDMRELEVELQRYYMGRLDPRELVWRWKRLLHTWKICHPNGQVKYRWMTAQQRTHSRHEQPVKGLSRIMGSPPVRTWGRERHLIPDRLRIPDAYEASGGSFPKQVKINEVDMRRPAAAGLWSFPIEALGDIGEGKHLRDLDYEPNRFLDLRGHWPELLLVNNSSRF